MKKKQVAVNHNWQEWGIAKYGYKLLIDKLEITPDPFWPAIIDEEDDEKGNVLGVGVLFEGTKTIHYLTEDVLIHNALKVRPLIGHVGRTDVFKLQKRFAIRDSQLIYDTAIAAHLLNPTLRSYGLKELAANEGIEYPTYQEIVGDGTLLNIETEITAQYCACDVYATAVIHAKTLPLIKKLYPC